MKNRRREGVLSREGEFSHFRHDGALRFGHDANGAVRYPWRMTRISFLGLGLMGSAMARRLLDHGFELTLWNRNPVRAAEHLDSMPGLRRAARIIRHQLERYDGAGVPDALRGDRIPLGSRILAIASAFDLLTTCASERPRHWQDALLHMGKARGDVFDPWLLDLFSEEIAKEPPELTSSDRNVMIVPGGTSPWRTLSTEEEVADEGEPEQLEVLIDEIVREEPQ